MSSRYNTIDMHAQYQHNSSPGQFHEGHPESKEWNLQNEQQKPHSESLSSHKGWASTDTSSLGYPSPYHQTAYHPGNLQHGSHMSHHGNPPRGSSSSSTISAARYRSNSNSSNISATQNHNYHYNPSHMSYSSQVSGVSSYNPSQYSNQQNQQRSYSGDTLNQPTSPGINQYGTPQYEKDRGEYFNTNRTPEYQQQQQGYFQHHHSNNPEGPLSPNRRTFHEATPSSPMKQPKDQVTTPHGSPRVTNRTIHKRREGPSQPTTAGENNLLSLDQYEEMLQQIASPGLGPTGTREPRSALRRSEYDRERDSRAARQPRRKQDQQRSRTELDSQPQTPTVAESNPNGLEDNLLITPKSEDRKSRRRSSLPSSFGDTARRIPENSHLNSVAAAAAEQGHDNNHMENNLLAPPEVKSLRKNIRRSWENGSVTPRDDLIHTQNEGQAYRVSSAVKKFLLSADEDEEESQRTTSIDLERSGRLESDEISILVVPDENEDTRDKSNSKSQYSRSGAISPSNQLVSSPKFVTSSPRLRSASPLCLVNEETDPGSNGRQLSVSDDISSPMPSPTRLTHSGFSRSRPTTPVSSIRPPQAPLISAPISLHGQSTAARARKSSPAGRRMKSTPPVTNSAFQPNPPRQRTGSIASISSMSSVTMDTSLHQAHPSQPLPSLPPSTPPTPTVGNSEALSQRRRKPSGGRDLVVPTSPLLAESFSGRQNQLSIPAPPSPPSLSPELGAMSFAAMGSPPNSTNNSQAQIARLRKRVSTLEKELETLGNELSNGVKDRNELHTKVERLTIERDMLEKQVSVLQEFAFGTKKDDDDELRDALKKIEEEKDEGLRGVLARQDNIESETVFSNMEMLGLQIRGAGLESRKETEESSKDEIQRLRNQLSEQEQNVQRERNIREELELKLEALQLLEENKLETPGQIENSIQQELDTLRSQQEEKTRVNNTLQEELEVLKVRLREEENKSLIYQENIVQLSLRMEQQESQDKSEIQKIQRDHEEVMERVVIEHANALMEQSESSRLETEKGFSTEKQQAIARERILEERLKEQCTKNELLEETIFKQERSQQLLEEDRESWMLTRASLERQLEMEQLQRQESAYKIEQTEKENKRLRAILSDLDLAALLSAEKEDGPDSKPVDLTPLYEIQRQQWLDQISLLKRKVARADETATEVMQKNMELMVTLDMLKSS